jgi:hypothetical protein
MKEKKKSEKVKKLPVGEKVSTERRPRNSFAQTGSFFTFSH